MTKFRLVLLSLSLTVFPLQFLAQDTIPGIPSKTAGPGRETKNSVRDTEKIKQDKLKSRVAEEILADANKLPVGAHRAFVLAKAGQHICKTDRPRAEAIFEKAVKELIVSQNLAEKPFERDPGNLYYGFFPRLFLIDSISRCDPELGYLYLHRSRPKSLSDLVQAYYNIPIVRGINVWESRALRWELNRERVLKSKISAKNPDRLVEFIKKDIEHSITSGTLGLLKSLFRHQPRLADQLTEKAVYALVQLPLFDENKKPTINESQYNFQIALAFLDALGNQKPTQRYPMRVSDDALRKLADKVSQGMLDNGQNWGSQSNLTTVRQFFPERFAQLTKRQAESIESLELRSYRAFMERNPSSQELISMAEDFSPEYQKEIFKKAACRLVEAGAFVQAKTLLTEKLTESNPVESWLASIYYASALKALGELRRDDAVNLANQIPNHYKRAQAQAILAKHVYATDPGANEKEALLILNNAKARLDTNPSPYYGSPGMDDILRVYAEIDEKAAFQMFDQLIDQINKDEGNDQAFNDIRPGTIISSEGTSEVSFDFSRTVSFLKKQDFERILEILNKLNRRERRVNLKLTLLENRSISYGYNRSFEDSQFCDR